MTDSDRDDLARMFFTVTEYASWQEWETTSEGIRRWCRAKADEAMAAGWRKVGVDQVVVSREDGNILDEWERYNELERRVAAALADPAGANGGE